MQHDQQVARQRRMLQRPARDVEAAAVGSRPRPTGALIAAAPSSPAPSGGDRCIAVLADAPPPSAGQRRLGIGVQPHLLPGAQHMHARGHDAVARPTGRRGRRPRCLRRRRPAPRAPPPSSSPDRRSRPCCGPGPPAAPTAARGRRRRAAARRPHTVAVWPSRGASRRAAEVGLDDEGARHRVGRGGDLAHVGRHLARRRRPRAAP